MILLGVDPGRRRVGVAVADTETRFARPLEVIDTNETDPIARVIQLIREREVECVVVGHPVGLSGRKGPAVAEQQQFLERLRVATDVQVVEHDERLSTVVAEQGLRAGGGRAAARRQIRDAVAAQVILQGYLDAGAGR
ncbi:MAG TPA: Holliday junction resolvase RuvX [Actinomycetota bacterium]|nr:Holliday junction resolvase RuvX [Actinomycetota bacterium]